MPRLCSVFGCPLSDVKKMKPRFCGLFSLPSEPVLRQKWLDEIPNDISKLKNPLICLKHFKESDVISKDTFCVGGKEIEIPRYRFTLEKGAIPRFFGNELENQAASKSKRKGLVIIFDQAFPRKKQVFKQLTFIRMAGNKILRREPVSAKQGLKLQRKRDVKHKLQDVNKPALSRTQSASEVLKKRKKEKVQNPLQSEELKQDCDTETTSVIVKEEPMDFKEELDLPAFVTVKGELNEAEREEEEKAALLEVNPLEDTPPAQLMSLDEHMMHVVEVVDVQNISSRLYLKEGMMRVVKVEGVNSLEENPPMQYRAVKEEDLMLEAGPPVQRCGAWRAPPGPLWAFSAAQEAAFAGALRLLLDAGFRLDAVEVRHKAFQFAEAERLPHSFCRKTQTAGALFLDYFLRRHPDVAARLGSPAPQPPLAIPRLPRRRVWSVSELTFPIDRPEMLGRPRTARDTSRKGEMATVVACADAAGRFLPPLVVLRQPAAGCAAVDASAQATAQAKHAARACARALPPGGAACLSSAGVLTEAAFERWLLHFERHRRPRGGRCLLLLSEHAAHKSLGAVAAYSRQRLALRALHQPPPLHHAFVPALRRHYAGALLAYERRRHRRSRGNSRAAAGRGVDRASFGAMLAIAWKQAATASNAIEGFRAVGLQDWNLTYDSDGSSDESDDAVENIDFEVDKQELG